MTSHSLCHSRMIWSTTGAQQLPHLAEVFGSHYDRAEWTISDS
jgi:hypothetical protein